MLNKFGVIEQLRNPSIDYTKNEKMIAHYILENIELVTNMSIHELAENVNVSPTAISRFCKRIGVPDYKTFKLSLSTDYHRILHKQTEQEKSTSSEKSYLDEIISNLKVTYNQDQTKVLREVAQRINRATIVYVFGIGFSKMAVDSIALRWTYIGRPIVVINERDTGLEMVSNAPKSALFIGISNSGNSQDVHRVMLAAKDRGITTVSITKYERSIISELSDLSIFTSNMHVNDDLRSYNLYSQLLMIDLLYSEYLKISK